MEQNITTPPAAGGESQMAALSAEHEKSVRFRIALLGFFLFLVFVVGLFWMFTTPNLTVGLTLSFVAGLSMIFLPCTLPLAFVIVPLTMGKDPKKGLLMALSFTLGLTITLSLYGIFIAAVGRTFGLKSDAEVYAVLFGGLAAFIFGLSEIGLIKFKLPSYSGKFPDFIQRQKDYMKTFLLGLLLGNAGVGCPNPAFYILLGYIATVGDLFNGWFLGFVHGVGRSVPLIFLAILGTLGVNALSPLVKHKEAVERAMGWVLVIIGAYLLTFGIFGHDWFIASGIHGAWERFVVNIGGERFGETILKHEHTLVNVPNFIRYGNLFFLALLALTFFIAFIVKKPSRRTIVSLFITYVVIASVVGYSTAWTFKTSTGGHINIHFQGEEAMPHEDMMEEEHGGEGMMEENGHGGTLYQEESEVREGLVANLNFAPPVHTGDPESFRFFVNEKPGNIPVPPSELEVEHSKLMHVIGVRSDLNEFFHIHPVLVGSYPSDHFAIDHFFYKPGIYKIWSEVKKGGRNYTFGYPEISVEGPGERYEKKVSFERNVVASGYQVSLKLDEPVIRNQEAHLIFDIHDLQGREIEVEQFLDAAMHIVVVKDDLKKVIHTHPGEEMEHMGVKLPLIRIASAHGTEEEEDLAAVVEDKTQEFHIVFPEAGLYKVFAQFRPRGIGLPLDEALTASFWIKVEEKAPLAVSGWWINLLWSSVAIVILGLGVKKFLKTKTL